MKKAAESKSFDKVVDGLLAVPYKELQRKLANERETKAKQKKRATTSPASRVSDDRKS